MLDRTKLLKEVEQLADTLFVSYAHEATIAQQVWQRIANDPTFIHAIKGAQVPWPLPTWQERLDAVHTIPRTPFPYRALAVDGSQIYPDRHQGISCYLLNVGSVAITYGVSTSSVELNSQPYTYMLDSAASTVSSTDLVNCQRQELEFAAGLQLGTAHPDDETPKLLLFDGSLIFWQLIAKDGGLKQQFFPSYIAALQALYQARIPFACYISRPSSKELLSLIRTALCDFDAQASDAHTAVDHLVDTTIAHFFLTPWTRTTVFKSNVPLCAEYPVHLQPYFVYMHVDDEIVRVELPAWIAHDDVMLDFVMMSVADQASKGRGYPVVLAEAHEQAVVKGPDREFFYHLLTKIGIESQQRVSVSQKSIKKRGIGI